MQFDPAIAAQVAFKQAEEHNELGTAWVDAEEAEEVFSASAGEEARQAYDRLLEIGARYPDAAAYQEFLIYITWQQATEETVSMHFKKGVELCDQFLRRHLAETGEPGQRQVREIRASFKAGLGMAQDDELEGEFKRDAFHGGD